ncbi:hypothetical protein Dimus_029877 [Dionaea muscipula]
MLPALCFILILLILILLPTLIYVFFYSGKCPPQRAASQPVPCPAPPTAGVVDIEKLVGKKMNIVINKLQGRIISVDHDESLSLEVVVDQAKGDEEYQCPVCLSGFANGEEIRQLSLCRHTFHAPCIDKWLYTHSSCPVCRAFVVATNVK